MRPDLAHLQGSQQAVAQLSNEERVAGLRQERWIEYPRAKRILERLADLVDYPPRDRMPCLVIYGGTGMGKTRIVQKFLRDHRAYFDQKLGRTRLPVLSIQMPPALGATTAQALRQFVEDLLTLLISGLNPNGVNSPRHCSRQDILHILTTLVVNAAPSADPSTRSQRYRRGVTLWSSLLSVLPPHVGAQLEEASRRWPLRLRRRFAAGLRQRIRKRWPYNPYRPTRDCERRTERQELKAVYGLPLRTVPGQS